MKQKDDNEKFLHKPSTHETFVCLSDMTDYCKILFENSQSKPYVDFLNLLLKNDFFNSQKERVSVRELSSSFQISASKITKWIHEIYKDLFELNNSYSDLFQKKGLKVTLQIKNRYNYCTFYTSLPVLPKEFETVEFFFLKAKVGIQNFWVKRIDHVISLNNVETIINLEGGLSNKYREFILEKALFYDNIHFMDLFNKNDYELDNLLKRVYPT